MKIIYLEGREPFGMYLKVLTWRSFLILISYFFTVPGKCKLTLDTHKNWVSNIENWFTWSSTQLIYVIWTCTSERTYKCLIKLTPEYLSRKFFLSSVLTFISVTLGCVTRYIYLYIILPPPNAPSRLGRLISGIA